MATATMTKLPTDCLEEIFLNLEEEIPSLRSCLLVNRRWCKLTVPILWRWPFFRRIESPLLIPVYLQFLKQDSKALLNVEIPKYGERQLFDYPSYLHGLSWAELCKLISICQ